MFEYEYLEAQTTRSGENGVYRLAHDLETWISRELEKRRVALEGEFGQNVRIYLTMRSYKRWPVFVMGQPQEDGKKILEAWYFHMIPATAEQRGGLQLILDKLSLRLLFPENKPEPRLQPKPQPPRNHQVRPQPKPKERF